MSATHASKSPTQGLKVSQGPRVFRSNVRTAQANALLKRSGAELLNAANELEHLHRELSGAREKLSAAETRVGFYELAHRMAATGVISHQDVATKVSQMLASNQPLSHWEGMAASAARGGFTAPPSLDKTSEAVASSDEAELNEAAAFLLRY